MSQVIFLYAHAYNVTKERTPEMPAISCVALLQLLLLLLVVVVAVRGYNPRPNPKSVVEVGNARFTVLTERLVRMEWGGVNDAATFTFINRDLLTPSYNVSRDGSATLIQTPFLTVMLR